MYLLFVFANFNLYKTRAMYIVQYFACQIGLWAYKPQLIDAKNSLILLQFYDKNV